MFSLATASAAIVPACSLTHFSLALGRDISEATGQHSLSLRLANRGPACQLLGYPSVVVADAAGPIPFVIAHRGDQMVTAKRPVSFVVKRQRAAYVLLNNYRCDLGTRRAGRLVTIGPLALRIRDRYRRPNWCGRGDPGSTLAVSPFEPTLAATLRHA